MPGFGALSAVARPQSWLWSCDLLAVGSQGWADTPHLVLISIVRGELVPGSELGQGALTARWPCHLAHSWTPQRSGRLSCPFSRTLCIPQVGSRDAGPLPRLALVPASWLTASAASAFVCGISRGLQQPAEKLASSPPASHSWGHAELRSAPGGHAVRAEPIPPGLCTHAGWSGQMPPCT